MTQIKINQTYELILLLLKKNMHQRELSKSLKTSLTKVQSILKDLRGLNVVDYKEEGKNHIYFLKKNLTSKLLILNAENYKLVKTLIQYPTLEIVFGQILRKTEDNIALIFGSYAKGTEKKESDIDLYIDTENQKLKHEIKKIYSSLSVKIGKFNTNDLLVKEIMKNHIILRGGEKYYEKIKFLE